MGWVALAPLLAALATRPAPAVRSGSLHAFAIGLATGLTYFVGTIYWTGWVMRNYGDLPSVVAWSLMLLLAAYLALYPALFALITHLLVSRLGRRALLLAPAVWVTTELGRGYLFTGFPWVLLGYSQATVLPIAQLASVTGVYGLSALLVLSSVAVVLLVFDRTSLRWWAAGAAAVAVAATASLGSGPVVGQPPHARGRALPGRPRPGQRRRRTRSGTRDGRSTILQRYLDLTRQAAAGGARFILWPESALPFFFQEEPVVGDAVRRLAFETRTSLLFGSDQIERTHAAALLQRGVPGRPGGDRGRRSTGRCTSCRSASTCR